VFRNCELLNVKLPILTEFEICILCKELTDVPKDLHIDKRKNYVEGVGQLCDDCAKKICYSNE